MKRLTSLGMHCAAALLLLVGCGGAAPQASGAASSTRESQADDGHRIVLHRAHRAGEAFDVSLRGMRATQTLLTLDGQPARDDVEQLEVVLIANVVIREVNANGKATLSEYTVRECTTGGESPEQVLPPGAVFTVTAVEAPGDGAITLPGGDLTEEQTERLDLVVSTRISQMNDDDIFGSNEPRAEGETWPVEAAIAARDLSKIPNLRITAENVSGTTTLSALEEVDGVQCQRVDATMSARDFELLSLPEGSRIRSASLEMNMSAALPIDTSQHRLRSATSMDMRLEILLPNDEGRTAVMTVRTRQASSTEIRP